MATHVNSLPPRTPPQAPVPWALMTPSHIHSTLKSTIATTTALHDKLIALPLAERTFDNVFRALGVREGEEMKEFEWLGFGQYVCMDKEVRDASQETDRLFQEFGLTTVTNLPLYQVLLDAQANSALPSSKPLTQVQKLLQDRMILDRTRSGLSLPADVQKELLELKKKMVGLEVEFSKNCNEENGSLVLSAAELDGVPKEVTDGYEAVEGGFKVTFKTPDIIPIFKFASSPIIRSRATLGYENKTINNKPLLDEVVALRKKISGLLGYENWAEYILEVKMAKTASTVHDFLSNLEAQLLPLALAEKEKLLAIKHEDVESGKYPAKNGDKVAEGNVLRLWDVRYYERIQLERELALDEQAISQYFPVKTVVPAILKLYEDLLGLEIVKMDKSEGETWHEEAEMYAIWNSRKDGAPSYTTAGESEFLGYMHLDLYPRANKYGHAAVWGLIPGYTKLDGSRNYPVVCMVANLAKPTGGKPALMKHQEAVTFMHEFGHAAHSLCSKTEFARFHGTAVARDFVEAPSQMLENWCWTPKQLKQISSHYERPGESLPDSMIEAIVASKSSNQGLFNLRQLFHAKYDMLLHTSKEDLDLTKTWCDLREKTSLVSTDGNYIGGQSGFAHIVGGYSAGYYGYLYSQVFSADMWATVFESDPMNPLSGKAYRDKILAPGGSRDEMESLIDFLGRKPDNKAFMDSLMSGAKKEEVEGAKL